MTLPNLIVIGTVKGGTTSMYEYLREHPQVYMSPMKETNFFSSRWPLRTQADYEAQFDGVNGEAVIGEASPGYLAFPGVARRIHDLIPAAKLIAILRNPADRAFSEYWMRWRGDTYWKEPGEITAAFQRESFYVAPGFYYEHLRRFFDLFPPEQLRVYITERMNADTAGVMADTYRFLGVDDGFQPDLRRRHNVGYTPKSGALNGVYHHEGLRKALVPIVPRPVKDLVKRVSARNQVTGVPEIPEELRRQMVELYREDIERLQALLDEDLSIWLDDRPAVATPPALELVSSK